MEAHEQECIERIEECKKCKCPYKINDKEVQHDCIKAMKE